MYWSCIYNYIYIYKAILQWRCWCDQNDVIKSHKIFGQPWPVNLARNTKKGLFGLFLRKFINKTFICCFNTEISEMLYYALIIHLSLITGEWGFMGSFSGSPWTPGTRSATASPSRPCTANTVVTIAEEPGTTHWGKFRLTVYPAGLFVGNVCFHYSAGFAMEGSLSEGCKMDENQPSDLVMMHSGSRLMGSQERSYWTSFPYLGFFGCNLPRYTWNWMLTSVSLF